MLTAYCFERSLPGALQDVLQVLVGIADEHGVVNDLTWVALMRVAGKGSGARRSLPRQVRRLAGAGVIKLVEPTQGTKGRALIVDWERIRTTGNGPPVERTFPRISRATPRDAAHLRTDVPAHLPRDAAHLPRDAAHLSSDEADPHAHVLSSSFEGTTFEGTSFEGTSFERASLNEVEGAAAAPPDRRRRFRGHELLDRVAARLVGVSAAALMAGEHEGGRVELRKLLEGLEGSGWEAEALADALAGASSRWGPVPADQDAPVGLLTFRAQYLWARRHGAKATTTAAAAPSLAAPDDDEPMGAAELAALFGRKS